MDKLNTKHIMFVIWGTAIVSIKTNANIFIRDGQRDAWLSMLIASFITLFFVLYITNIMLKSNEFNFVSIYRTALGKFMGNIFLFILIGCSVLTLTEAASVEASAMHTNIFIETPTWYLCIFFVIPAIYTVKRGVAPVIMVAIIGVLLAIFAGINLVILTAKYKNYNYLLPILADGITVGFLKSLFKALGYYSSIIILFPFYSYIKEKKDLKRHVIVGIFFVIQMHVVSIAGAIAAYGANRVVNIAYPKLLQTQEINYFGFLESGELFVMWQIIGGWYVKYILTFFITLKILKDMNIKNRYIVYFITVIVYIFSYFISTNLFFVTKFLNIYAYICLVNYMIIPSIIFAIFNYRHKKSNCLQK
jgi:spore germination protein (amino acid permease)